MSAVALPPLPVVQQPVFTPAQATVLSIWPFDQTHVTYHAGQITYGHPAAEKNKIKLVQMNPERVMLGGKGPAPGVWMAKYSHEKIDGPGYTRIDVYDTFTSSRNWAVESEKDPTAFNQNPITARAVATMLVSVFSGGRSGDHIYGGPGVKVYDPAQSLEAQLAEMDSMQRLFAEGMVHEAEYFANRREYKSISDAHRKMAQWLGYQPKDWGFANLAPKGPTKKCVNCGVEIPKQALQCVSAGCGVNLVLWFEQYGLGADDDAVQNVIAMKARLATDKAKAQEATDAVLQKQGPKPPIRT